LVDAGCRCAVIRQVRVVFAEHGFDNIVLYVLNAVQGGADGVMISGCLPEQCHFKEGNLGARRQLDQFADFLDHIGYERNRVRFTWLDLQDRGRIQRDLAQFEADLTKMPKSEALATRVGGHHD